MIGLPDGAFSFLLGLTAFVCGVFAAIALAVAGSWWGLLCIPLFPMVAVAAVKLWLGADA